MKDVLELINNIQLVLQYIAPGYLSLLILYFILNKKIDIKSKFISGCLISYILISIVNFLRVKVEYLNHLPNNAFINSIIALFIGIIFFTLFGTITKTTFIRKLTVFFYQRTINDNIWQDVFDYKNGSNLKIYIKDKDYYIIGHLKNHEINTEDSWFAISAFGKYNIEDNTKYNGEEPFLENHNIVYLVRLSDIEHIEVFNK